MTGQFFSLSFFIFGIFDGILFSFTFSIQQIFGGIFLLFSCFRSITDGSWPWWSWAASSLPWSPPSSSWWPILGTSVCYLSGNQGIGNGDIKSDQTSENSETFKASDSPIGQVLASNCFKMSFLKFLQFCQGVWVGWIVSSCIDAIAQWSRVTFAVMLGWNCKKWLHWYRTFRSFIDVVFFAASEEKPWSTVTLQDVASYPWLTLWYVSLHFKTKSNLIPFLPSRRFDVKSLTVAHLWVERGKNIE